MTDLYKVLSERGHELSKDEIIGIAKEALFALFSELKNTDEYYKACDSIIEHTGLDIEGL
jgi:hypothetical protein